MSTLVNYIWLLPFAAAICLYAIPAIRRNHKGLKIAAATVVSIWFFLQVVACIMYWGVPQYSDAGKYITLGSSEQWYPTVGQLTSENYIFNPGYVNFLIVIFKLTGSLNAVPIINIALNIILLCSVAYIVKELAQSRRAAIMSVIFFCILPSNILSIPVVMTELLFTAAVYFSIATFRSDKSWLMIVSGLTMAYANYVRPIALIFIVAMALYALVQHYRVKALMAFAISFVALTASIAAFNHHLTGHTFAAGSTGGVNLIMGANDDMDGSYGDTVFKAGHPGYIGDKKEFDVFQKDEFWKDESLEWIKAHPGKYIAYMPIKLARLWLNDTYHDISLQKERFGGAYKLILSLPYYLIMCLCIVGIWQRRRKLWGVWGIYLLPLLAACAMHALLYGGMRYHYPFMPIVILFATEAIKKYQNE